MLLSTANPQPSASSGAALVVTAALAGLLVLRIVALHFNATDLFFDEAQYWTWSLEPAFGYYSKPPLVAWIIGLFGAVCGDSPFCIRLPAPILHTATAAFVYLIGRRLHGERVGVWAALTFATLPGVSLSSGIMSTDVPLLLGWAAALWAFIAMLEDDGWGPAIVLGLALGFGFNAKYAMVFFIISMAVYLAVTPDARRLLSDRRLWAALGLGALLLAPNMAWNLSNSFATFAHTADNAKWGGALVNVSKGLEFVAAQNGVFGPILFVALLDTIRRAWHEGLPDADRLLLCFVLPVLLAITAQAFASRAHANWAATAYVAGSVLVVAALSRRLGERWLGLSMGLHAAILLALVVGSAAAGRFTIPGVGDPFHRTLGWQAVADTTRRTLDVARGTSQPFRAVITDERAATAELLYYMRREPTPVLAWHEGGRPKDHYELTRPFRDATQVPILLVSLRHDATPITRRFAKVVPLGEHALPAGLGAPRRVRFFALSGYRAD